MGGGVVRYVWKQLDIIQEVPFSRENPGGRKNITILPSTASLRILLAFNKSHQFRIIHTNCIAIVYSVPASGHPCFYLASF